MKSATMTKLLFITCLVIGLSVVLPTYAAFAQDNTPAALPTDTPPPSPTNTPGPTNTPVPPTNTPPPGSTATPTNTPVVQPPATSVPSRPVPIPEPVTVVLFGTGLAALSAAIASRRKKDN